jgi:hypothetical protein
MSEHAEDPAVEEHADHPVVVEEHVDHPAVVEPAEHPVRAERGAVAVASREHDVEVFDHLDKGFSKAVLAGYVVGVVAIFAFTFFALAYAAGDDIPLGARIGAAVGVAGWIGIMGGVVAVGRWSMKHESEIFHS